MLVGNPFEVVELEAVNTTPSEEFQENQGNKDEPEPWISTVCLKHVTFS